MEERRFSAAWAIQQEHCLRRLPKKLDFGWRSAFSAAINLRFKSEGFSPWGRPCTPARYAAPLIAVLAATAAARRNGTNATPASRSYTSVHSAAHSSHSQKCSTCRGCCLARTNGGVADSPGLVTRSVSTKNNFPSRSLKNGLPHCELAHRLSMYFNFLLDRGPSRRAFEFRITSTSAATGRPTPTLEISWFRLVLSPVTLVRLADHSAIPADASANFCCLSG